MVDLINISTVSFTRLSTDTFNNMTMVPSFEEVRARMIANLHKPNDQDLIKLENTLNEIIKNSDAMKNKNLKKLLKKLPNITNEALSQVKLNAQLGGQFSDKQAENQRKQAWAKYYELKQKADKESNSEKEALEYAKERDKAFSEAMSMQTRISNVTGKAFEGFLDILAPLILTSAQDDANVIVDQMVAQLGKKGKLNLQGAKSSSISFAINYDQKGKNTMQIKKRTISAPGKVDVSVVHPSTGEHLANISAKNYSTLRDIHLLKNGNLLGMIAAWPLGSNPNSYNYIYTGLGWKNDFFVQQIKTLLAIQSAAGRNQNENELADILILNIRDQKNKPIRVISIYDLMEKALLDPENTNKAFKVSIKPQLPIPSCDDETYMETALSITVDTTLQKKWLKNYLSLGLIKK